MDFDIPSRGGVLGGMTPGQRLLGQGHLSGMSPDERTAVLRNTAQGLDAATAFVPVTGPLYQMLNSAAAGDMQKAALNAGAMVAGPFSQALPNVVKLSNVADDTMALGQAYTGMGGGYAAEDPAIFQRFREIARRFGLGVE